jgi:hypothetical protein
MTIFSWFKLAFLEKRLQFGEFGKYNRYRYLCLTRQPKDTMERLRIAHEVLEGPSVNTMEAQANELSIRQAETRCRQGAIQEAKSLPPRDDTPGPILPAKPLDSQAKITNADDSSSRAAS